VKAYYCDQFVLPLPDGHRFPMRKYAMVREQAVSAGILSIGDLTVPDAATDEQLLYVHSQDYVGRVVGGQLTDKEIRRIGFPWSPALVERSRRSVGGTISACRSALEEGIAINLAGGTHHAFADFGSGFCVFNDAAVAARVIQRENGARQVLIVDCDVHQGDGTAHIFAGDNSVFTFSIHGKRNFPFHKQTSDLDVELDDGADDAPYHKALEVGLRDALASFTPGQVIYLAGADPYVGDRLGRLNLSKDGLRARDRYVLQTCRDHNLPVAVVMAGGYARDIQDIVDIHVQTIAEAARLSLP
jgi:acetoin utilization deacetylase AcuC-like enzyme